MMDELTKKATLDEMRVLQDEKVDQNVLKTYLSQKVGLGEFDALR